MKEWSDLSEAFAFLGNSLLAPMSQTGDVGASPVFWREFPYFGDDNVHEAVDACLSWAMRAQEATNPVQEASKEFAMLFMGPPSPAAAPWETFYREESKGIGFGRVTFEMRGLLRDAGLELANANHQYEDHVGIELLYLSVLCGNAGANERLAQQAAAFCDDRLLIWLPSLLEAVSTEAPGGYIEALLKLAQALCGHLVH